MFQTKDFKKSKHIFCVVFWINRGTDEIVWKNWVELEVHRWHYGDYALCAEYVGLQTRTLGTGSSYFFLLHLFA